MLPSKPPKYTERFPEYVPIHYQIYHPVKSPAKEKACLIDEEVPFNMFLSRKEKCFLVMFTTLALISLLCTATALFLDKHAITGTDQSPSTCMLTHTHDCKTVYTSNLVRNLVEVSVRVDLFLSCIAFTTGVTLTSVSVFNCRVLIAFLLTGIVKTLFINSALLLILTNNEFYFNTVYNVLTGNCGHSYCLEDENANVVVAFILLATSGIVTFMIMLTIFVIGTHILRKYDESHQDFIWAKWDAMTAELVAF